jgi:hypothetical protein
MKKILIIEDDKTKIERLTFFFKDKEILIEESFQKGITQLKNNLNNFEFLILDMTIPLWEKGCNDLGGNYEQFGGEKILREMKRRNLKLPTILFTMFDIFPSKNGTITFNEVNANYLERFSDFYMGGVLFNSEEDNWKNDLSKLIAKTRNESY